MLNKRRLFLIHQSNADDNLSSEMCMDVVNSQQQVWDNLLSCYYTSPSIVVHWQRQGMQPLLVNSGSITLQMTK